MENDRTSRAARIIRGDASGSAATRPVGRKANICFIIVKARARADSIGEGEKGHGPASERASACERFVAVLRAR